jgi:hypothetical protein
MSRRKKEIDWFKSGWPDAIYKRALGDPMQIPPRHLKTVQQQFRSATTKLLNRHLGRRDKICGICCSQGMLRHDFENMARKIFEYICGSNDLTRDSLFERAKDGIIFFAEQFDYPEEHVAQVRLGRDTAQTIAHIIVVKAHVIGQRYALTPK